MAQSTRSFAHTMSLRSNIISIPTRNRDSNIISGIEKVSSQAASNTVVKITHKTYNTVFQGYPDVLDVKQVSELLGVSTKTVYRLLHSGTLGSLKVGREFRIPKLYLMQYLKVTSLKATQ